MRHSHPDRIDKVELNDMIELAFNSFAQVRHDLKANKYEIFGVFSWFKESNAITSTFLCSQVNQAIGEYLCGFIDDRLVTVRP